MTLRLLLFASEFPPGPGGIGTHAHQVALHLSELGWKISVVAPQQYTSNDEVETFNQAQPFAVFRPGWNRHRLLRGLDRYRSLESAWKDAGAGGFDAMLASGAKAVWLGSAFALSKRLPWLAVGHGSEFAFPRRWERALTRLSFGRASAVICVSQYTWNLMERNEIHPRRGAVVPNGAEEGKFLSASPEEVESWRAERGLGGKRVLVTVGNVTERKGQEIVIRALPRILKRHPNTVYLMVGLPTERDRLEPIIESLKLTEHVRFLGRQSDQELRKILSLADLFVMTSVHTQNGSVEGYGIACVEAAFCGTPSVVSQGSGLSEAVQDGVTGIAVPPKDPGATADAIGRLLSEPETLEAMGKSARARALDSQTWSLRAQAYDQMLRRIAQRELRD